MRFPARLAPVLVLALVVLAAGCNATPTVSSGTTPPPSAAAGASPSAGAASPGTTATSPAASLDRVSGWQSDLALLVPGMERLHADLYHGVSEEALEDAVRSLSATVPTATDDELLAGVLRIVAMVSAGGCDGHTGAFIWGTGRYPLDSLPLRLWLFGDDLVVVDALPPYEELIGGRIVSIEARAIAEVIEALDPLVPRDNAQTVRLLLPRFVIIPQVLRGAGLADAGPVSIVVEDADGRSSSADVEPIPMVRYNGWAGQYGLHLPANPEVPYLSRIDDALWWEVLEDGVTLFVQYNRVDRLGTTLLTQLENATREPAIDRIVLDVRHNFGGELDALEQMVALFQVPTFDEPDRLFVVTGRNTFSAGSLLVARLQRDTAAEVLGEAMGGCPTFWANTVPLDLPWSGIQVSVAEDLAVGVDPNDTRHGILPDVTIELTLDEWLAGEDPVLDSLIGSGP